MSSNEKTVQYTALEIGDRVQEGDQWLDEHGQWQSYVFLSGRNGVVGYGVRARRPIAATQPATYEEVPGSRTTQQAVDQPKPERIAYEDLQPGDIIQEGDEWQTESGRWKPFASLDKSCVHVRFFQKARRPYKISTIQEIGDALANAQKAATQLQDERDEARTERDLARSEVARLSTELWARKPLEDRISSLTDELAQARAEGDRLQEVVNNLYNEPTARQVQQMLRTWATELDWSAGCFDSVGRDEIDTIQKTLVAVIERIESIVNPEGGTDDN